MNKLSRLEKRELKSLFTIIAAIAKHKNDNSDDINDFLYSEFEITTSEPVTLKRAITHFTLSCDLNEKANEIIKFLSEHFDIK